MLVLDLQCSRETDDGHSFPEAQDIVLLRGQRQIPSTIGSLLCSHTTSEITSCRSNVIISYLLSLGQDTKQAQPQSYPRISDEDLNKQELLQNKINILMKLQVNKKVNAS